MRKFVDNREQIGNIIQDIILGRSASRDDRPDNDIHRYIYNLMPFKESSFGWIFQATLQFSNNEQPIFVKVPKVGTLDHELAVGLALNKLRLPNFVYTFDMIRCSSVTLFEDSCVPSAWCETQGNTQYLFLEAIPDAITLHDFVKDCTFDQFLSVYLQVLYALRTASKELGFTHYDLHPRNVVVSSPEQVSWILTYRTELHVDEYLQTNNLAVILDFGQSKIENQRYLGLSRYGIDTSKIDPLGDSYKLLMMSLRQMRSTNPICYKQASKLARFFNRYQRVSQILKEQQHVYYVLQLANPDEKRSLDDYLRYIRSIFHPDLTAFPQRSTDNPTLNPIEETYTDPMETLDKVRKCLRPWLSKIQQDLSSDTMLHLAVIYQWAFYHLDNISKDPSLDLFLRNDKRVLVILHRHLLNCINPEVQAIARRCNPRSLYR